ncbi:hypothetical protein ACI2K4_00865 [Micromonospora sp. NPDC050397]|uniref:hypothetical protein n=1 Tax=Micromonospora sp. NPDC050397 TaxID=3364279 RepID=UPI00384D0F54
MIDVSGDFEIHITTYSHHAKQLAAFAEQHGVKFLHILLDRGTNVSQPMLTFTGSGTLEQQRVLVEHWRDRLREAGLHACRAKIEAAPWCTGVPQTDRDAADEPGDRYFEHHVKVLLSNPTVADLVTITDLVAPHGARLSQNARRQHTSGQQERFVNQRGYGIGLTTAEQRLESLVVDLVRMGVPPRRAGLPGPGGRSAVDNRAAYRDEPSPHGDRRDTVGRTSRSPRQRHDDRLGRWCGA